MLAKPRKHWRSLAALGCGHNMAASTSPWSITTPFSSKIYPSRRNSWNLIICLWNSFSISVHRKFRRIFLKNSSYVEHVLLQFLNKTGYLWCILWHKCLQSRGSFYKITWHHKILKVNGVWDKHNTSSCHLLVCGSRCRHFASLAWRNISAALICPTAAGPEEGNNVASPW